MYNFMSFWLMKAFKLCHVLIHFLGYCFLSYTSAPIPLPVNTPTELTRFKQPVELTAHARYNYYTFLSWVCALCAVYFVRTDWDTSRLICLECEHTYQTHRSPLSFKK